MLSKCIERIQTVREGVDFWMRLRSLREQPNAAAAPRKGTGPGTVGFLRTMICSLPEWKANDDGDVAPKI